MNFAPAVPHFGSPRPLHRQWPIVNASAILQAWVNTAREEWKVVNGRNEKLQAAEAVHEAAKKRAKDAVRLTSPNPGLSVAKPCSLPRL